MDVLDKAVAFASTRCGIPVKINEFKLAERLEDLLDVALGQLEMERPNVESAYSVSETQKHNKVTYTHCIGPPGGAVTPGGKFSTLKSR